MTTTKQKYDKLDLIDVLANSIEQAFSAEEYRVQIGFLDTAESLQIINLPNSQEIERYMDGTRDMLMNFELSYKSTDQYKAAQTLFNIASFLDTLDNLESTNGSFDFLELNVVSMPFLADQNEQYLTYVCDFQVLITLQ